MTARMQDGHRPAEARQQQPGMALDDAAVAPVEAQRIDQHDDARRPSRTPATPRQPTRLADQQRQRHHPQHGRVGQHARAAGRHALHAEIGEGEEEAELEGADRQHDRPVGAAGQRSRRSAASRTKALIADRLARAAASHTGVAADRPILMTGQVRPNRTTASPSCS